MDFTLHDLGDAHVEAAARLLVDVFRAHWPDAFPSVAEARAEIEELRAHILWVALDGDGACWD